MLENMFPAQWKTEFQSYFSQKLLESAREKKKKYIYICIYIFFFNGYDIKIHKIQKGNFPAVGINEMLFILIVLFCLFYI